MANHTLPQHFVDHIQRQQQFTSEQLEKFIDSCTRPLRKSVRANTLKIVPNELETLAEKWRWNNQPIPWCKDGIWIETEPTNEKLLLGNIIEHLQGLFYIQEASSMLPAEALKFCQPDAELILDVAAAPGSKTTQLAQLYPEATIVANELSSSRLKSLHANIQRCGVKNSILTHLDGKVFGTQLPETFDAILLDAPCGGEGTLRKDPDALNNWSTQALDDISGLQKELIISAYRALKPGGHLIYSTCTLSKEENQDVVRHLLDNTNAQVITLSGLFQDASKSLTPEGYLHVFPHIYDSEGFFIAALNKPLIQGTVNDDTNNQPKISNPNWGFKKVSQKIRQQISKLLKESFGFQDSSVVEHLWLKDTVIWWFPENASEVIEKIKVKRVGIKIAEIHKEQINLHHEFVSCYGETFTLGCVEVTSEEAKAFMQGRDLSTNELLSVGREYLIRFNHHPLGLAKALKNKLKNRLPRPVVRDNPVAELS